VIGDSFAPLSTSLQLIGLFLSIDVSTMAYVEDGNFLTFVIDSIQNPIVTDPDPPASFQLAAQ
jgi:hypothetical protein